ncbi:putative cation efflux protein [Candidatus Zixiibacteriota bacterium]|nr:putative cation efflux protein [candidate division Zixibacteria bacterium]
MSHDRAKQNTAALSVASNTTLVVGKLIVGLAIGSISVISEAIHSGIDLIAAIVAFFAVRESAKPPDREHPFGHGKAESLSGAFEGLLIFVAIVIILYEAAQKIIGRGVVEKVDLGLVVMGISAAMNFVVSRRLLRVAKETDSLALEADALHLSTDVFTSLGVFAGLLLIKLTGWHILDPLIAIGVAVVIGHAAFGILRRSVRDLMDEKLSDDETDIIVKILDEHRPHFVGFHDLRSRKSGNRREIDLHLVQCRFIDLENAHKICDHLEEELVKKIHHAHVTIHVEPCDDDCDGDPTHCQIDLNRFRSHLSGH